MENLIIVSLVMNVFSFYAIYLQKKEVDELKSKTNSQVAKLDRRIEESKLGSIC